MGHKVKDTKEKIIRQALIYFIENDYEGASLNDIAGALGVTKGAIYHYFGSKDELFKAAVHHMVEELGKQMSGMWCGSDGLSFKDTLALWFNFGAMMSETNELAGTDLFRDYANVIYLMFTAIKKFPEVRELMDRTYRGTIGGLHSLLEKARQEGEIRREIDTGALAFEMTAFAEGSLLLGGVVSDLDLLDMGQRCFDNFWLRVRPDAGEEGG